MLRRLQAGPKRYQCQQQRLMFARLVVCRFCRHSRSWDCAQCCIHVTSQTPSTFLLQAEDDPVDHLERSLVYYAALRKAKARVEMHLYAHGGHAFGLRRTELPITGWPQLVETWLGTVGMIPK
jgi:acetyl esterase/lipase